MKIPYSPRLSPPLSHTLLFLLFLFLPFQERFFKWLKPLSKLAFKRENLPSHLVDPCFDYYLGEVLMLGALLIVGISLGKKLLSLFWDKEHKYLTLFLLISLISLPFSLKGASLWPYLRWAALAIGALSCHALCLQVEVKKVLSTCFLILLCASLLEGAIVISQYYSQHQLGFKHLGELQIHAAHSASIGVASKQRWIFDALYSLHTDSPRILRPYGTLPHPNVLGAFMGMVIFGSYFLYLEATSWWKKTLTCLALIFQIFILFLSYSRGAVFALLLSTFLFIALERKRAYTLLIPLLLGLSVCGLIIGEQIVERGGIVNYNALAKSSDLPRLHYHNCSTQIAKKHPLLGCGWGQSLAQPESSSSSSYLVQKVHNIYLLLLAETGVLGLSSFLLFLLSLLYFCYKVSLDRISRLLLSLLFFFLLFGLVDHFSITMHHGREMLFLTTGLLSAYLREKSSLERELFSLSKPLEGATAHGT